MSIKIPCLFILCLSSLCLSCFGQGKYQVGSLPSININKGLNNKWSLNFKYESRQFFKDEISEEFEGFAYILSDFSLIASRKVGLNNSFGSGYLIRLREDKIIHRAIQQFTIVSRYDGLRLAHRFSTDQTFEPDEEMQFRIRYRISPEIALNGESVDPREFYFKLNNEYLNSFEGSTYDLEIRIVPLLGYEFSNQNKVEGGLDYRINSFINDHAQQTFFININWFVKI